MKKTACVLGIMLLWSGMVCAAPTTADLKRIEQQLKQDRQAGLEAERKAIKGNRGCAIRNVGGQIYKERVLRRG